MDKYLAGTEVCPKVEALFLTEVKNEEGLAQELEV